MADRIYLKVIADFDITGYMRPRAVTWKDGRMFRIEELREHRSAATSVNGIQRDCYTVVIKGQVRRLYFEKDPSNFTITVGRWYVEKEA
jgi:hypothetical protein